MTQAMAVPGLRLGPVRFTAYGLCAAAGVLLAMTLAGKLAKRRGAGQETAWDAGLLAILSCFAASRLLLVLADPHAFVRYPMLVLGLPSLTYAGMAVAAVATILRLRQRGIPLLPLLDVFAGPGALLGGFLELGHWLDGSDSGMPRFRGGQVQGFVPVAAVGVAVSLGLAVALVVLLTRKRGWAPGRVAAWALGLGGCTAFVLDMLSLPAELESRLPLEGGQMMALLAMVAGAGLWTVSAGNNAGDGRVEEAVEP